MSVFPCLVIGVCGSNENRGDAAGFQQIFPGYGTENHQKLQSISQKYDPYGVFQTLMPGGFKVF